MVAISGPESGNLEIVTHWGQGRGMGTYKHVTIHWRTMWVVEEGGIPWGVDALRRGLWMMKTANADYMWHI